ncbi:hypothetical protein [Paenibacillus antarcticus]|nr:hypothetical protein [Paenibacillus antarcticus]
MEQLELFPKATESDIELAIQFLIEYPEMMAALKAMDRIGELSPSQKLLYASYKDKVETINIAVSSIIDEEVKDIIQHRYFKVSRRKYTVMRFQGKMSESTIDRRIEKGLITITNTLKVAGII